MSIPDQVQEQYLDAVAAATAQFAKVVRAAFALPDERAQQDAIRAAEERLALDVVLIRERHLGGNR